MCSHCHIRFATEPCHPRCASLRQIAVSWSGVPSPDPTDLLAVYRWGGEPAGSVAPGAGTAGCSSLLVCRDALAVCTHCRAIGCPAWRPCAEQLPRRARPLHSPPDAYAAGKAPIKFANASDAPGYLASGAGSLALRLVNLRANMRVVLVRGGPDRPVVAARGPVIRCGRKAQEEGPPREGLKPQLCTPRQPYLREARARRPRSAHRLAGRAPSPPLSLVACAGTTTPTSPRAST